MTSSLRARQHKRSKALSPEDTRLSSAASTGVCTWLPWALYGCHGRYMVAMGVICHLPGFASSLYFVITGLVYSLWCSHRSSKSEKRLALFFPTYSFRRFPPVGLKSDDAIDIERTSASLPIIPHCFPKTAFDTRSPPPHCKSFNAIFSRG